MEASQRKEIISRTRQWIADFIIALTICPFAGLPFRQERIRYVVEPGGDIEVLIRTLLTECLRLYETPVEDTETTLIIHPQVLQDFADYNDFLALADELLAEAELEGILQIASFHPRYRFADAPDDDPANYTNRSPYPMLHLLREASVSRAVDLYPNVEDIPAENIRRLRAMGEAKIRKLLD